MELRHLRYCIAVADERHFGRAAARLRIAQPPLSRQIQDLERELGFSVFERSSRGVSLTAAGEVFVAHARRIFDDLEVGIRDARRALAGETGRLVVGYLASLQYSGITGLLRAFRARRPGVEIALREMPPQQQIEALKEARIDVGFVRAPFEEPTLAWSLVRKEELLVALPRGHHLARRATIDLAELAREPFVFFPRRRGPSFFDHVMRLCAAAGFSPRIVQEAPQLDVASLVAAGFGVSIVPSSIRNVGGKGLLLRRIAGAPAADLLVAWRADDRSPALAELLAFVRSEATARANSARRRAAV
jgi:DNA-binding transcriptional LysR family regulator